MIRSILLLSFIGITSLYAQYETDKLFFKLNQSAEIRFQNEVLKSDIETTYFSKLVDHYNVSEIICPFKTQEEKLQQTFLLSCSERDIKKIFRSLKKQNFIEYVEYVPIYETSFVPNDPMFGNQWGLQQINSE